MRILVKIGGAQLAEPEARASFCSAVADARHAGNELIVVHGGGEQVSDWARRLGLEEHKVDGLRVTDGPTAEVVLAVIGGQVNRTLVAGLQAEGVSAVGLTGADGGSFSAHRHTPDGRDLGYVGEVDQVRPELLQTLLAAGFVPVIATVAPLALNQNDPADHLYNVNADSAAAPLAAALDAEVLLMLTDVPGVLGAEGELLSDLSPGGAAELEKRGVLVGGMLPKVRGALAARAALPGGLVKIAPADVPSALLAALEPDVGTTFIASLSSEGTAHHG